MIPKFNAASHIPLMSDRMSLDWEKVAREVMWLEDEGAESLVISVPAGTPYLTNDTIIEYVEAVGAARRSLAIICDVGARRTEDAVTLASEARGRRGRLYHDLRPVYVSAERTVVIELLRDDRGCDSP